MRLLLLAAVLALAASHARAQEFFVPIPPCRAVDTRNPTGPRGGPSMGAGSWRVFALSGTCGLPWQLGAISLNVTVVPPGGLGYLTLWPAGQRQPLVSTLNSPMGTVVANAAIVPCPPGGVIAVYVTDATDVIFDVNGYFSHP